MGWTLFFGVLGLISIGMLFLTDQSRSPLHLCAAARPMLDGDCVEAPQVQNTIAVFLNQPRSLEERFTPDLYIFVEPSQPGHGCQWHVVFFI